jgi:glycosyltransferase involved in cell wall biosynthesis
MDFRPDFPSLEIDRLRAYTRNAMLLCDLENCSLGYSPTLWQRDRLPSRYRDKVRAVFDGVDTDVWRRRAGAPRVVRGETVPDGMKIVTYAARGFEAIRGFDKFMQTAKRIGERRRDVLFVVAGQDQIFYGGDQKTIGGESFKNWTLAQDDYDLSRFAFAGMLPPERLAELFSISDLHLYWTVPFVLSWSLMNALSCGAAVLASGTAPVQEMIEHGQNGLLADFFDIDGFVEQALAVLDAPHDFASLGRTAAEIIRERYSLDVCDKLHLQLYEDALGRQSSL